MSGETFSGTIGFKSRQSTLGNSPTTWICTVTVTSASPTPPQVLVVRLLPDLPGKPPPGKAPPVVDDDPATNTLIRQGALTVTELDLTKNSNNKGTPVTTKTAGEASLTLAAPPGEGATWCVLIETPLQKGAQLAVRVRASAGDKFTQVALTPISSLTPVQVNASTPQVIRALIRPVPRLALGINIATPTVGITSYRGFTDGGGDASSVSANGFVPNDRNLQALLFRIFVLLDQADTLNPVWDSEAGGSSVALQARAQDPQCSVADAEEVWARQVTEMLLGVPYDSPQNTYDQGVRAAKTSALGDLPFCGGTLDSKATGGTGNPIYGIPFACQHLATFGILSRGQNTTSIQLGAASMTATTVVAMKGKWFVDENNPTEITDFTNLPSNPDVLKPGKLQISLANIIAQVTQYGPGSHHLFSNAQVGPFTEDTQYDALEAFVKLNALPKPKGKLSVSHPPEFRQKAIPAVDATNTPILDKKGGTQLRRQMRLRVDNFDFKTADSLIFPSVNIERDQQGAAHIGFTLRVRNGKAQFFDTGGLNAEDAAGVTRSAGVNLFPVVSGMHSGTMDDLLATTCHSIAAPFRGVGVFGRLTDAAAPALAAHVSNVLQVARPVGMARLYILKPGSMAASQIPQSSVLFASAMQPMYDTDASTGGDKNASPPQKRNYAISRYLWSLRGLPAAGQVEVVWVIYAPKQPLSAVMVNAQRSDSLTTLVVRTGSSLPPAAALAAQTKVWRGCLCNPDGTVLLLDANRVGPLTSLEGRGTAPALVPLDVAFPNIALPQGIPGYFT